MSNDLDALIGRREFIAGGTALALMGSQSALPESRAQTSCCWDVISESI
jgi:hypothetical protein